MDNFEQVLNTLKLFQSFGCPSCNSDCSAANPAVICCPMQELRDAINTVSVQIMQRSK